MAAALERHGHVVHRIGDVGNGGTTAIRVALSALSRATRRQRIRTLNKPYCTFARRALAPARVAKVISSPDRAVITAIVDEDQLSLASIHYLRSHYQEAIDIYKRILLDNR